MEAFILLLTTIWLIVIPIVVAHKLDKTNPKHIDMTFIELYFKENTDYTKFAYIMMLIILFPALIWWLISKGIVKSFNFLFVRKAKDEEISKADK